MKRNGWADGFRRRVKREGEEVIDRMVRELEDDLGLPKQAIACLLLIRVIDETVPLTGSEKLEIAALLHQGAKDVCGSLESAGYDFAAGKLQ